MKLVKRESKEHYPTFDLKGLTLGQLLAITNGLTLHNTIVARELKEYLCNHCPELAVLVREEV